MTETALYLAGLANVAVLGVIGLMLRSLGRSAPSVVDLPVEPEYRVAALQQPSNDDAIVLNIDQLDACDLRDRPAVAPLAAPGRAQRHHHHH